MNYFPCSFINLFMYLFKDYIYFCNFNWGSVNEEHFPFIFIRNFYFKIEIQPTVVDVSCYRSPKTDEVL